MKVITLIIITSLFLTSCTRRIATTTFTKSTHHGGQVVKPSFEVKKLSAGRVFGTIAAGGILAVIVNRNFKNKTDPQTGNLYSDKLVRNRTVLAAGLGSFLAIGTTGNRETTESVIKNNFDDWLSKYNRKNNKNYILAFEDRNGVHLVEEQFKREFILAEKERLAEIERQNKRKTNTINANDIRIGIGLLDAFLNVFGGGNADGQGTCGVCNGRGKRHFTELGYKESSKEYYQCQACGGDGKID